jgi:1,4-dihydroxy-2-naphthoate octaprenyltransferase
MSKCSIWLEATRPKTLPAAVTPVLLGSSAAAAVGQFLWQPAAICLLFALLVQIGTNFANDYLDAVKGGDTAQRIGPRRAVAAGLVAPPQMRRAAIGILSLAFLCGLGLIPYGGWWLLLVGLASVLCAWLYTGGPYPLAYNGLGDVFVVLFFGFVAVGCTYFVQTGGLRAEVLLLGLSSGLLINNLLVVNNYRDYEEDRRTHKRTLVVRFGRGFALQFYRLAAGTAALAPVVFYLCGYGLAVCLALLPAAAALWQAQRLAVARTAEEFTMALRAAGAIVASYGLLFSLGLVLG